MSEIKGLQCDSCKGRIMWEIPKGLRIGKGVIEQKAREEGWQAPTKDGRHLCAGCRRPDGRAAAATVVARGKAKRERAREARHGG